jgi:hypothetical protein
MSISLFQNFRELLLHCLKCYDSVDSQEALKSEGVGSGVSNDYFPFGSHSSMRVPSGSVTQVKRP